MDAPVGIKTCTSAVGTFPVDQFFAVCQSVDVASVFQTALLNFGVQSAPVVHDSPTSKAPISAAPELVWGTSWFICLELPKISLWWKEEDGP